MKALKGVTKVVYVLVGFICLVLGAIGLALPVMPTLPFLIVAAYLFSRSSPRLHRWLLELPYFGRLIREWKRYRVVPPYTKWGVVVFLTATLIGLIVFVNLPIWIKIGWAISGAALVLFLVIQLKTDGFRK